MKIDFDTLLSLLFLVFFVGLPLLSRVMRQRNRNQAPPGRGGDTPSDRGAAADRGQATRTQPRADDLPAWVREAQRRVQEAERRARDAGSGGPTADAVPPSRSPAAGPRQVGGRPIGRPLVDPSLVPEDPFDGTLMGPGQARRGAQDGLGREGMAPSSAPPPRRPTLGGPPGGGLGREGAAPPAGGPGSLARSASAPAARRGRSRSVGQYGAFVASRAPASRRRGKRPIDEAADAGTLRRRERTARRAGRAPGATLGAVDLVRTDRVSLVRALIWHEILDEPASKRRPGRPSSRLRSR